MKNFMNLIITLAFSVVFAASAFAAENQMTAGTYNPTGTLVKVEANGLVCDFCARAIEKVFMKQPEISGVGVNLSDHLIAVSLKDGQEMSDEKLTKLITDAGYNVAGITREEHK